MKKWFLYGGLAAGILLGGLLPFESNDVGRLRPVKTIQVEWEQEIRVTSDLGDRGIGDSWAEAMEHLEAGAPGVVFYDTGEYLLLGPGTEKFLPELLQEGTFRASCRVYRLAGAEPDLEAVGAFLDSHPVELTLNTLRAALARGEVVRLPTLHWEEGRMWLEEAGD